MLRRYQSETLRCSGGRIVPGDAKDQRLTGESPSHRHAVISPLAVEQLRSQRCGNIATKLMEIDNVACQVCHLLLTKLFQERQEPCCSGFALRICWRRSAEFSLYRLNLSRIFRRHRRRSALWSISTLIVLASLEHKIVARCVQRYYRVKVRCVVTQVALSAVVTLPLAWNHQPDFCR